MNKFLIYILLITNSFIGFSQNETQKKENIIFCGLTEIPPVYTGGIAKYMNDIKLNLKYPKTQASIQGRIYVSFLIDTLGRVTNVEIAKGINKDFNNEALRIVKLLDNWIPGTQRGKPINVKYTVPINFKTD